MCILQNWTQQFTVSMLWSLLLAWIRGGGMCVYQPPGMLAGIDSWRRTGALTVEMARTTGISTMCCLCRSERPDRVGDYVRDQTTVYAVWCNHYRMKKFVPRQELWRTERDQHEWSDSNTILVTRTTNTITPTTSKTTSFNADDDMRHPVLHSDKDDGGVCIDARLLVNLWQDYLLYRRRIKARVVTLCCSRKLRDSGWHGDVGWGRHDDKEVVCTPRIVGRWGRCAIEWVGEKGNGC